jgi:transposase
MAANGMSIRLIADELNVGKSTVARWVSEVSHEAISGNSTHGVEE